jgi:hypothetical protein
MRRQLLEQFMTTVNIQGSLPLESGMYFLRKILIQNSNSYNQQSRAVLAGFIAGETGIPGENHRQVIDKLYHTMLYTSP